MGETVPGGRYRVGDALVDANGKPLGKGGDADAAETQDAPAGPGVGGGGGKADAAWPDGFPSADLLQAGGVKSAKDAQAMSRDDLIALPGVGPARADAVLAWQA